MKELISRLQRSDSYGFLLAYTAQEGELVRVAGCDEDGCFGLRVCEYGGPALTDPPQRDHLRSELESLLEMGAATQQTQEVMALDGGVLEIGVSVEGSSLHSFHLANHQLLSGVARELGELARSMLNKREWTDEHAHPLRST